MSGRLLAALLAAAVLFVGTPAAATGDPPVVASGDAQPDANLGSGSDPVGVRIDREDPDHGEHDVEHGGGEPEVSESGTVGLVVETGRTEADAVAWSATVAVGDPVVVRPVHGTGRATVEVRESELDAALERLRSSGAGDFVEFDGIARAAHHLPPTDPQWSQQEPKQEPGFASVGIPGAWEHAHSTGGSTVVAVVDTGVNKVSELDTRVLTGRNIITGTSTTTDDHKDRHGTLVATVLAARGNNSTAAAGVCWSCRVLPVKVLDSTGEGRMSDVASGIRWAADNGARIIALSLTGPGSSTLDAAIAHARSRNVLLVAAAGNDGGTSPQHPAASPHVIGVGGTALNGTLRTESNRGSWVDVAAPYTNVGQRASGQTALFHGTSSATPVVAGVAALVMAAQPGVSLDRLEVLLTATAKAISGVRHGRIDAEAAVRAAMLAPLTVGIAAPPSGSVHHPQVTVTLSLPAGFTGVTSVRVDGRPVARGTASSYTRTLAPGRRAVRAVAVRTDGAVGASGPRSIWVDVTGPLVGIHPYPGSLFGVETIEVAARDFPAGVAGTPSVRVGGTSLPVRAVRKDVWAATWDTRGIATGTQRLTARAVDTLGNPTTVTLDVSVLNRPPPSAFVDVPRGLYFTVPVDFLAHTRVTTGVGGSNRYEPATIVTRAQMAVFLWRMAGQPRGTGSPFVDVPAGSYFDEATRWLRHTGVTTGVGGSNFYDPHAPVTRDQMVTFLHRFAGRPSPPQPHPFVDVDRSSFAEHAISWAAGHGVTTGVGGERFDPAGHVDRGQMATFIHRYARTRQAHGASAVPLGI